jgi:hypothetical protein
MTLKQNFTQYRSLKFHIKQRAYSKCQGCPLPRIILCYCLAAPRTCLSDQHAPRPACLAPTYCLSDCYYLQHSASIEMVVVLSVHDNNNLLFNWLTTVNPLLTQ